MPQDNNKIKELLMSNELLLPEVVRLLNEGHTVTLPLKGRSMRPFLQDGRDKALLTKAQQFNINDAVLAETAPLHYVLHRVVGINGDHVTLLGDGNLTPEHCTVGDVKGLVVGFYRDGRERLDRTDAWKWKIYSYIWTHLLPLRRYLLYALRKIGH